MVWVRENPPKELGFKAALTRVGSGRRGGKRRPCPEPSWVSDVHGKVLLLLKSLFRLPEHVSNYMTRTECLTRRP